MSCDFFQIEINFVVNKICNKWWTIDSEHCIRSKRSRERVREYSRPHIWLSSSNSSVISAPPPLSLPPPSSLHAAHNRSYLVDVSFVLLWRVEFCFRIPSKTTHSFVIHLVQTNYKRIYSIVHHFLSFIWLEVLVHFLVISLMFTVYFGLWDLFASLCVSLLSSSVHSNFFFSVFFSLLFSLLYLFLPLSLSSLPPCLCRAAMSIINIRRCQLCVHCHSFPLLFAYLFLSRWIIVCHCLALEKHKHSRTHTHIHTQNTHWLRDTIIFYQWCFHLMFESDVWGKKGRDGRTLNFVPFDLL